MHQAGDEENLVQISKILLWIEGILSRFRRVGILITTTGHDKPQKTEMIVLELKPKTRSVKSAIGYISEYLCEKQAAEEIICITVAETMPNISLVL